MSDFNRTIDTKSGQHGNGSADGTAARLTGAVDNKCYKGVRVKKDGSESDVLYVGFSDLVTASNGYALEAGDEVFLEVDTPYKVWVIGSDGDVAYSWIAY